MSNNPKWVISSVISPLGIPVGQSWIEIGCNLAVIQDFSVGTFIEIGLDAGGMCCLLYSRMQFDKSFHYYGIDISRARLWKTVADLEGPNVRIDDVFADTSKRWIWDLIHDSKKRALIFCDGGNKALEMQTFAPYLKEGDLIMAHDYTIEIVEADLPAGFKKITPPYFESARLVLLQR